jgi:TonB family protein
MIYQTKHAVTLALLLMAVGSVFGQKKARTPKQSKKYERKTASPIISLGVMNSRAVNLVKPEYPRMASEASVYGRVAVEVVITEEGKVESAKAISGPLLLRSAAVGAALQSTFEPFILSDKPMRVSGFINYHFLPRTFNWLEIGFALGHGYYNCCGLYGLGQVIESFPIGYEAEKGMLKRGQDGHDNRQITVAAVIEQISARLEKGSKQAWLFALGETLGKMKRDGRDSVQKGLESLKLAVQTAPDSVAPALLKQAQRIVRIASIGPFAAQDYRDTLSELEDQLPLLGR